MTSPERPQNDSEKRSFKEAELGAEFQHTAQELLDVVERLKNVKNDHRRIELEAEEARLRGKLEDIDKQLTKIINAGTAN